ncbi:hypothetical protein [Paraliomyxa miuraensis]|uniref:hypothetical protein n=1 Tax=Paraliomyxa miuraensis TaxID=376150 RepID=UPI002259E552|nr:hypothetical protein [Paraliomyxa miuraensis]
MKCYAHPLGDCFGKMEREHFISEIVLKSIAAGKSLSVTGWANDNGSHPIAPSNLNTRMLCARHNRALSPIDKLGGHFYSTLQAIAEAAYGGTLDSLEVREAFCGPDIERWMLKALCGLLASGRASYSQEKFGRVLPPGDLLEVVFREYDLPPPSGLVLVSTAQLGHDPVPGVAFRLASWGGGLGGLVLQWWSFAFVLIVRPPAPGPDIDLIREGSYRPRQIWLRNGADIRIDLDWPEPWNGPVATPSVQYRPRRAP